MQADEDVTSSLDKDTAVTECNTATAASDKRGQSIALREDLIDTAVHFLLNPRVKESSLTQKRAFLDRKGLTADEIDIAIERAASGQLYSVKPHAAATLNQPSFVSPNHFVQHVPIARPPISGYSNESVWYMARMLAPPMAIVAGVCYAVYVFYKRYIEPLLFGKQKHPLVAIQESVRELSQSMNRLSETLISVEDNIKKQIENDMASVRANAADALAVNEIKSEVQSLKALLLNRKQFPATPKIAKASIPNWQLTDQTTDNDNASLANGNASDSSDASCSDAAPNPV